MENASAAFLDTVRLSMRAIRNAMGAATIDPALLTAAEQLQHEGFLRREDTTRQILALKEAEHSIKEIVRGTRHSPKLARHALRGPEVTCSASGKAPIRLRACAGCSIGGRLSQRRRGRELHEDAEG